MVTMRLIIVVLLAGAFVNGFGSTEAATDEAPALEAATLLKSVGVRQEPARIMSLVEGNGAFRYEVSLLDGNRLVLDLLDVENEITEPVIPVDHPLLHRIRIGVHHDPRMTRLVYDLRDTVQYSVVPIGRRLVVTLHESIPAPQDVATELTLPLPEGPLPDAEQPPVQESTVDEGVGDLFEDAGEHVEEKMVIDVQGLKTSPSGYTGQRISLDFQAADLRNVLRMIAEVSRRNMVIGEAVSGQVAIRLLNVPWDQGLDVIMRMHSLGKVEWGKVIFIDTVGNIARQQEAELLEQEIALRVKETELSTQELVTELIPVNYADLAEVAAIVADQLSSRGDIKQDLRTQTLIVRDVDASIHEVRELVRKIDSRTPQVLIEARIVSANRNFARSLGIQWGIRQAVANPTNPFTFQGIGGGEFGNPLEDFMVNLPAQSLATSTAGFTYGKLLGDLLTLDMRLSAGETLGLTNIVSSPKIITLDNKKAIIQQGTQIPFQTVSQNGTQTTFVDAALVLDVLPHVIAHDDTISLKITATRNSPGLQTPAGLSIDTKEAQTEVLVKNGETIVIGGILEETKVDASGGIPYLSQIPVLGWMFKNKSVTVNKTELLIFITPTILE